LYVNPTLTAAADWRSIEWSNNSGWGLYGAGTAPNFLGGNLTVSRNQNDVTSLTISNTTSAISAQSILNLISNTSSGNFAIQKASSLTSGYKIFASNDGLIYNSTAGDIAILNDFATGKIKFAAGASSTAQATLTAAGRLLLGTTTESTFALDVNGTARVSTSITSPQFTVTSRLDIFSDGVNGVISMQTLTNTLNLRKYVKVLGDDGGYGNNNASAAFQIDGTNRGFLPPRLTTTQKNAIGTPAAGLIVYDTDTNKLCCYNGTTWNDLF
jgi:hypothetical protein